MRTRLANLDEATRAKKSAAIVERLLACEETQRDCPFVCMSFLATASEPELSKLHEMLLTEGKTLAFPRVISETEMEAYAVTAKTEYLRGAFGILEPDPKTAKILAPEELDLILLPCLAFDKAGHRLGHGKGYYDRYLTRCEADVTTILVAFAEQELPAVACDEYDIPAQQIITA